MFRITIFTPSPPRWRFMPHWEHSKAENRYPHPYSTARNSQPRKRTPHPNHNSPSRRKAPRVYPFRMMVCPYNNNRRNMWYLHHLLPTALFRHQHQGLIEQPNHLFAACYHGNHSHRQQMMRILMARRKHIFWINRHRLRIVSKPICRPSISKGHRMDVPRHDNMPRQRLVLQPSHHRIFLRCMLQRRFCYPMTTLFRMDMPDKNRTNSNSPML